MSERGPSRVLHCIPSMQGGGAERQLVYLAGALTRRGWDVHVALNAGGPNLTMLQAAGATLHFLGSRGNHDPRMIGRVCRIIGRLRPALVQCWLLQMEVVGGLAAMLMRTPWILSERSSVEAYPPATKHRVRVAIGARADAIVANSSAGDEYWKSRGDSRLARYIVPNALPLEEIANACAAATVDAGGADEDPLVLFAGRFETSKNAETLVRALRRMPPGTRFRAYVCGDGPRRSHVERLVAELGLGSRTRVVGYVSNLWSVMKRASVLVSPSRFEGSPNVVLEAMACGCPLVVSDIRGHREILDDRCALLVDPDDVDGFARSIALCISDGAAARSRAALALSRVARHAIPEIGRQYLDVYRDVLSVARDRTASSAAAASS